MRLLNTDSPEIVDAFYQANLDQLSVVDVGEVLGSPKHDAALPANVGIEIIIGEPQSWPLVDLYKIDGHQLPAAIAHDAQDCQFCLVRMAFSLKVLGDVSIERTQFTAFIHGDGSKDAPIAYDMFPDELFDEVAQQIDVGISPTFKFGGIEASLANMQYGIRYQHLKPVILTAGMLTHRPLWEFKRSGKQSFIRNKEMYMIVKSYRPQEIRVTFEVIADIKFGGKRWPFKTRKEDKKHLTRKLCPIGTDFEKQQSMTAYPEKRRIKKILQDTFNKSELHELCFDLHVDYEDILTGDTKSEKITTLIEYYIRHGTFYELVAYIKRKRPHSFDENEE